MNRITVLESAGFLGIRIEKLLSYYGFNQVNIIKALINGSVKYTFKDSSLIIIDMDSRNIKPVRILKELKNESTTKDIPIILVSSQIDVKKLKEAISLGCYNFVTKPFNDDLLIEKVHNLVNKAYVESKVAEENMILDQREISGLSFVWQKDFEIGIEEIDREHKSIIDHYHQLYEHMVSGNGIQYFDEMVSFLEQYVTEHFMHEEAYQEDIKYPALEEHRQHHEVFRNNVKKLIDDHKRKEVTSSDLVKMNLMIKDWLLHHILVEDAKIARYKV